MAIRRHVRPAWPISRLLPVLVSLAVLVGSPTGGGSVDPHAPTPRTHVELVLPAGSDPAPVLSSAPAKPSPPHAVDESIFRDTQRQFCARHNRLARIRLRSLWRAYCTLVRPTQTPRLLGILCRTLHDDPPFHV